MEIRDDLIPRAYVLAEYDRKHKGPPGGARKIIEDAPAVDAIPVEWLEEHDGENISDSDGNVYGRRYITIPEALTMWQKEQEAQDE